MQNKIIFTPSTFACAIFTIGTIATFALAIVALVAVAWLLNLAMTVVCQVAENIQHLYMHADSLTQLLILCAIGYCVFRMVRLATVRK
jgi:hypothetical protein